MRGTAVTSTGPWDSPWTNVYGVARSSMAFGLFLTLVFTSSVDLFDPARNIELAEQSSWILRANLFVILRDYPTVARLSAIAILALVIAGWRPRWTALPHWWVAVSFVVSARAPDGGDQVHLVLTTLLLVVALTDARRWHWSPPLPLSDSVGARARAYVVRSFLVIACLQVAVIYLHACIGKLAVEEWRNGTAVYYWFTDPVWGAPSWMEPVLTPIVASPVGVLVLTWGTLAFEFLLAISPLLPRRYRRWILPAGLGFHFCIALVHGLISFFFSMAAALVLLLRWSDDPFTMPAMIRLRRRRETCARASLACNGGS